MAQDLNEFAVDQPRPTDQSRPAGVQAANDQQAAAPKTTRTEADSIGTMEVPIDAYYGVQSLRARHNFPITGQGMHRVFIKNLALVKKAAAITNRAAGTLEPEKAAAIVAACEEVMAGGLADAFIVDAIQGGAGTSANMNMNEVLANRAGELLGDALGSYAKVHPNDHVNMSQSTNDVIPTAGKLTVLDLLDTLLVRLANLRAALDEKSVEFDDVLKMGRTQLEDAVPMRLGQTFHGYSSMVARCEARITTVKSEMCVVNLGGTAIGSAINVSPYYLRNIVPNLVALSGYPLHQAADLFDATENLDAFAAVSGAVKSCATSISKMCNDLRLLSSGPRTGFGEINLPAMQNGSSIMPGKVNPVIPECVNQCCFMVFGMDTTVTWAASEGQLQLNAFDPVIIHELLNGIELLTRAMAMFRERCVSGITINASTGRRYAEYSPSIAAALNGAIGYEHAADIAQEAANDNRTVRDVAGERTDLPASTLDELLDPIALSRRLGQTCREHQ